MKIGEKMDIRAYNREMWNKLVENGNPWTIPVSPQVIAAARQGEWSVLLTETKPAPARLVPSRPAHGGDLVPGMRGRAAGSGLRRGRRAGNGVR